MGQQGIVFQTEIIARKQVDGHFSEYKSRQCRRVARFVLLSGYLNHSVSVQNKKQTTIFCAASPRGGGGTWFLYFKCPAGRVIHVMKKVTLLL